MRGRRWTADELEYLRENYAKLGCRACAANLKRPVQATFVKASKIGIARKGNIIEWSEEQLLFLRENFETMTSYELAAALGKKRTKVRMKYAELGLAKLKMEYWNDEMVDFLKRIYRTTGNVEIAEIFQERFPKQKRWTKNQIGTKLRNLKIKRTTAEYMAIAARNTAPGGRSYTINQNSSSVNMHDAWVAQMVVGPRNPNAKELSKEVLKHPQLISLKRPQILFNRQLKQNTL